MAIYTVHVPREAGDPFAQADGTMFVRDGFSAWAFLFGPFYLLRHRAYVAAAGWIVVVALAAWLCHLLRLPQSVEAMLGLMVAAFTGLEASSVRRYTLHLRGLDVADVTGGRGREDSERSYFQAEAFRSPRPSSAANRSWPGPSGSNDVIGLFPGSEI